MRQLSLHLHLLPAGAFAVPEVIHWAPGVRMHPADRTCSRWSLAGRCSLHRTWGPCHSIYTCLGAGLPKTRSGKIMRRILRKIADHKDEDLG
jgi:hypothetical protein